MTKHFLMIALSAMTLISTAAVSGEDEKRALTSYLSGDLSHINFLLSHDFQYEYFDKGKLKTLNRKEDLTALARLLKDTTRDAVGSVNQIVEDKNNPGRFRVNFDISFEDSPKIHTDSFFRGDVLNVEEVFTVTLAAGKIARISETDNKRATSRMRLGNLKTIYLGDVTTEWSGDGRKAGLFNEHHELIVWKKLKEGEATECFYFWPSNQLIDNFWYSPNNPESGLKSQHFE